MLLLPYIMVHFMRKEGGALCWTCWLFTRLPVFSVQITPRVCIHTLTRIREFFVLRKNISAVSAWFIMRYREIVKGKYNTLHFGGCGTFSVMNFCDKYACLLPAETWKISAFCHTVYLRMCCIIISINIYCFPEQHTSVVRHTGHGVWGYVASLLK